MRTYQFRAKLIHDDKRTGFKKGKTFDPKGFYYNGKKIILIGSVGGEHTDRISFPVDSIDIEVKGANTKCAILICEEAVKYGGSTCSDHTIHVFSKVFPSVLEAKHYAVKYQCNKGWPSWAKWEEAGGITSCDSGCYLWTIREE